MLALIAKAGPHSKPRIPAQDQFARSLSRHGAISAQNVLCEALSNLESNCGLGEDRLRALLVLDQHAHQISKRLLVAYSEGDAQLRSLDCRYLIASRQLCRAFGQAYERLLRQSPCPANPSWRLSAGTILVQLLRHRQVELLLRLFRYKKRNSEQWRRVHRAYRLAQAQGMAYQSSPRRLVEGISAPERAIERQFIQTLLLGATNTGQFSPRELLWTSHWIACWSSLLMLQPGDADGRINGEPDGFIVDLCGAEGLKRFGSGDTGQFLHLDTAPLIVAIDKEIATLNHAGTDPTSPAFPKLEARRVLLAKLRILFAPKPLHIKRRGDRKPVDLPIQSISGLPHIAQILRGEKTQRNAEHMTLSAAPLTGISILPISVATVMPTPQTWQLKDRSDSGCRLRGRSSNLNEIIPGSLIAIRESVHDPWTVAVIRRLRRLMVDRIEICAEYIGRQPRFVKVVNGCEPGSANSESPSNTHKSFGALYLPASNKHPSMPINTLVIHARAFDAGRTVTLLSSTATYTLRLNKPLEQQADFVWTSFTVIERSEHKRPMRSPFEPGS